MNGNNKNLASFADTTRLIFEAPRTVRELADICECTRETASRHIDVLVDNGMVREVGRRQLHNGRQSGPSAALYGWVLERCAA